MKNIGDEVEFKKDGIIQNRAKEVLNNAIALLENIERGISGCQVVILSGVDDYSGESVDYS